VIEPLLCHLCDEQRWLCDLLLCDEQTRIGHGDVQPRTQDGVLTSDLGAGQKVDRKSLAVVRREREVRGLMLRESPNLKLRCRLFKLDKARSFVLPDVRNS
jgi:hypothetical protein